MAQVVLRWLIQRDIVVIPRSVNIERMKQNIDIFDFALSDDDMKLISTLDTGKTLFFDHTDSERAKWIINVWKDKFE
ncbi:aldo/keto reductase [Campylobacter californiensis]|uniref:aldo/keto reductase n=1 Tax=Campylobacter californiensis TaxID=1032243 RepID=UPI002AD57859|nr:aldo/keto reductase [Campylobacter sp. RM12916]